MNPGIDILHNRLAAGRTPQEHHTATDAGENHAPMMRAQG